MTLREQFVIPKRYNTLSIAFMLLGLLSVVILYITTHGGSGTVEEKNASDARF